MTAVKKEADLLAAGGDENPPLRIGDFRRQAGTSPDALGEILQHGEIDEIDKVQCHLASSPVRGTIFYATTFSSALPRGAPGAVPEKEPFSATPEFAMLAPLIYFTEESCP